MIEKGSGINMLMKKAIKASIDFEALMDSIDFDSNIPLITKPDGGRELKNSNTYSKTPQEAQNITNVIITQLKEIEDIKGRMEEDYPLNLVKILIEKKEVLSESDKLKKGFTYYHYEYLVWQLFIAKKVRIDGRMQVNRKKEVEYYQRAKQILNSAFSTIEQRYFIYSLKKKKLNDQYNWVKILYYNELSICYSGLAESSMSLGYAEESCSLLTTLFPYLKNLEGSAKIDKIKTSSNKDYSVLTNQTLDLYTFALYNKGEAERNLHDDDKALRSFHRIVGIWNNKKNRSSDYYQALFRIGSLLIDQGRSEEAISILKKIRLTKYDVRKGSRNLEIASAFIDQREYTAAYRILNAITKFALIKQSFTVRKASLFKIRCLIECKKNTPTLIIKNWKRKFENIPHEIIGSDKNKIEGLIYACIEQNDKVNFKKACRYFSKFHELKRFNVLNFTEEQKNGFISNELLGYFMYLFYEKIDDEVVSLLNEKDWKKLEEKIFKSIDFFKEILEKIDDSDYLKDFFYCYIKNNPKNDIKISILDKLFGRLRILLKEMDRLEKLDKIEKDFLRWGKNPKDQDENLIHAKNFITKSYFHTESPFKDDERKYLSPGTIEKIVNKNLDRFKTQVIGTSKQILPLKGNGTSGILTVLRRWNSFTPGLSSISSPSKGGGYFLYFKDEKYGSKGIVIDPGHDFLANLFSEGFTINDIDVILLSHAHPDHTDNFPKILSLFHEMNGRLKERGEKRKDYDRKHLKIILTPGVYDMFSKGMSLNKKSLKDIFVVDFKSTNEDSKPIKCYNYSIGRNSIINIEAFKTSHNDLGELGSIGFLFEFGNSENEIKIGFTCDAQWNPNFWKIFKDCSIICAHLGSIVSIDKNNGFCPTYCTLSDSRCVDSKECIETDYSLVDIDSGKIEKQTHDENHLYLGGLASFFHPLLRNDDKLKLGIVSEFGEELKGGIRMDFYHKFDDWFKSNKDKKCRCLPADIGLRIDIFSGDVFCHTCQSYVDREEINPIAFGREEAIFFICKECMSVLSHNQIEEKLKDYYENGRRLELINEDGIGRQR